MVLEMENKSTMQFIKRVREFLNNQYNDSYKFKVERHIALSNKFAPFNKERIILKIFYEDEKIPIVHHIEHLYRLYELGYYYPERGEFAWQKELIDMIEGS